MATEQRAGEDVTRVRGNATVSVGTRGLDEDGIEREFEQSFAFNDWLMSNGTEDWRGTYRWLGPVKVMAYKEVGPPPWRWPKVGIQPSRTGKPFVRFIIGWRSTAYALCFMWAGRRAGESRDDNIGCNEGPASSDLGPLPTSTSEPSIGET